MRDTTSMNMWKSAVVIPHNHQNNHHHQHQQQQNHQQHRFPPPLASSFSRQVNPCVILLFLIIIIVIDTPRFVNSQAFNQIPNVRPPPPQQNFMRRTAIPLLTTRTTTLSPIPSLGSVYQRSSPKFMNIPSAPRQGRASSVSLAAITTTTLKPNIFAVTQNVSVYNRPGMSKESLAMASAPQALHRNFSEPSAKPTPAPVPLRTFKPPNAITSRMDSVSRPTSRIFLASNPPTVATPRPPPAPLISSVNAVNGAPAVKPDGNQPLITRVPIDSMFTTPLSENFEDPAAGVQFAPQKVKPNDYEEEDDDDAGGDDE